MPIKVSCSCGAAFAAKDELAGKTVKCPKCQQPLAIPGGAAAAPQVAPPDPGVPSIFDEAGIKAKAHTGQVCPSCFHPMKAGAILCIHCGYSLQLGRKMEMQIHGRVEGGHGEAAAVALQRAANTIEEDKREEKKKLSEGMPWWGYLLLFCAMVGLLTTMMLLPSESATLAAILIILGALQLVILYCWVMIIVIAFRNSVVQGVICIFPCYAFVYGIINWNECGTLMMTWIGCLLISIPIRFGYVYLASQEKKADVPGLGIPVPVVRLAEDHVLKSAAFFQTSRATPS